MVRTLFFLLIAVIFISDLGSLFYLHDLSIYLRATKEWLNGGDPYSLPTPITYLEGMFGGFSYDPNLQVWSPPWVFVILSPLAILPIAVAKNIYLSLLVAFFVLIARRLYRSFNENWSDLPRSVRLITAFLLPLFPLTNLILWGGIAVFSLCVILSFLSLIARRKYFLSGIVLSLIAIKIHVVALWLLLMVAVLYRLRKWTVLLGICVGGISLILITFVFSGESWISFLGRSVETPFMAMRVTATFCAQLQLLGIPMAISILISLGIGVGLVVMIIKRLPSGRKELELILLTLPFLAASAFFSGYAWRHDYLVVLAALPVLSGFEKYSFLTDRPVLIGSILTTAVAWMLAEPEAGHYAQHIGATILTIPLTTLALHGSAMRRSMR